MCELLPGPPAVEQRCYGDLFEEHVGVDPHRAELARLRARAGELCGGDWSGETRATLLDLLFSQVVEPGLPSGLVFVEEYPACQAALAALGTDRNGERIARRFEVFFGGMELGNGYCELTEPVEQRRRFEADNTLRTAVGKPPVVLDERLLAALEAGLPACSGVAVGVDRLLMCLQGERDIRRVLPFDPGR